MKICKFIEGTFYPPYDGASEHFTKIAENLDKNGHSVIIIHCNRGWSDLKVIQGRHFKTYAIPPKCFYSDKFLLEKIISEEKPDVLEITDMEYINSVGVGLVKKFHIPCVYDAISVSTILATDLQASESYRRKVAVLDRKLPHVVSGVFCFTELDKRNLIEATHLDANIIKVIPMGTMSHDVIPRTINVTDNTILFLGNMYFEPNAQAVRDIITVILPNILREYPNLKFKFVGDCPAQMRERYENRTCHFTGKIADINEIFEGVRLCIAPIVVGGGMRVKVLTYMSAGLPIISSSAGVEGIDHQDAICVSDDLLEFTRLMLNLLGDPENSKSRGVTLRKIAESKLDWSVLCKQRESLYAYVVDNCVIPDIEANMVDTKPFWLAETLAKGRFKKVKVPQKSYTILKNGIRKRKRIL